MTLFDRLIIAPLGATHDKADFQCGIEALDRYLQRQANQDIKRRISRVFVATIPDRPRKIIGYYSLSTLSITLNQLPQNISHKLPKHPIPCALIGRLAVSHTAQQYGVGKMLLADAIKRVLAISDQIAIYAMIVDAIDQNAIGFYEQFGFQRLSDDQRRLFLPLCQIKN